MDFLKRHQGVIRPRVNVPYEPILLSQLHIVFIECVILYMIYVYVQLKSEFRLI